MKIISQVAIGAACFVAAMSAHVPSSYAYGDAPWCAVINIGTGEVVWECQYWTFEACVPNVIAGNRGFCNVNPYGPPLRPVPPPTRHHGHSHHAPAHRG